MITLKDLKHLLDPRLNDPLWLYQRYHAEEKTAEEISKIIGCSPQLVVKKLKKLGITHDELNGVYTGRFHTIGKTALIFLMKPYLKKINDTINEIYDKTRSRNALIFKNILTEMEKHDQDKEGSSGIKIGLGRKQLYLTLSKFILCLYEYDTYYAERIDWVLREIIKHKDEFYFDEQSNPENWYPNRNRTTLAKYIFARNDPVGEKTYIGHIRKKENTEEGDPSSPYYLVFEVDVQQ